MFKIFRKEGFQITFANGWTASVAFGERHYAQHSHDDANGDRCAVSAEVAAIKPDGSLLWRDEWGTSVGPYLSPNEVVEFLALVEGLE